MSADNVILDEYQNGSPPTKADGSPGSPALKRGRGGPQRSRSRSPVSRQKMYESEGTNTTSDVPHLQRARLFVGNVDHRIHRSELKKVFTRYGEVLGVSIHKGFAFVQLDKEQNAKNAIIGEDNRMLNGARLHVEFSQAAKKAGAKYEDVEEQVADIRRRAPSPPNRGRPRDSYRDDLRDREAKLARVLAMEKELAYYRSQDHYSRRPPPSDYYDRRDHRDYSPPPRDYDRGGYDRRDHFYSRPSPPLSPPLKSGPGGYRDSYQSKPRQSTYDSRDSGYSRGGGEPSVGYGGSGGRMGGGKSSGGPPPGWPVSGFSKSSPNQRPFSSSGPWN